MAPKQPPTDPKRAERLKLREDRPDSWIPIDDGDELIGTITDVDQAWSDIRGQGSWYPLLTVQVDQATGYEQGKQLKVHCFSAVLYNEAMRRKPSVGEKVRFSYDGEREPKTRGHSPTKIYTLRVYGRENEGADVYASIAREQPASTVGRSQRAAEPDVPADLSDFATTPAGGAAAGGADEDIPF